ncbi:MAG: electron transport complex subunit RsxC [Clostridiales bacterium]|nr:electron transport complex subunit RsxC [Clostridiales bacterium]
MIPTFRHGVKTKGRKEYTENMPFEEYPVGDFVYIPLLQHIGKPATPLVIVGDKVKCGTKIGEADGFISANVHSSVSGEVTGIVDLPCATGLPTTHIVIKNDYKYEEDFLSPIQNPTKDEVLERCKEAGIVGMGGATFPTIVKLMPKTPIKALIINGCECEPYITVDYRLMLEKAAEVLSGIDLVKRALGVNKVYFGIESNKPEAIIKLRDISTDDEIEFCELKTKYPQGGEKQLISAITKEKVPKGGLPSDLGYVVFNVSTVYALYEAVYLGQPLIYRHMTVSGNGVKRAANLRVRIGVQLSDIVEYLGIEENVVKVVLGGPMMGVSLHNFKSTITKGSSSLLLLAEKEIREIEPTPCINCGRCAKACPMFLMPMVTDRAILHGDIEGANNSYAMSCIECGCCAYVCPARRPLVQSQRLAKKLIRKNKLTPA